MRLVTGILLCFYVFFIGIGYGQGSILVSGTVVDAESSQPLPYASLTLKGRTISTIANATGNFTFYIPALYEKDTLYISVIGYEAFKASLKTLDGDRNLFVRLTPAPVSLQEVTIEETLSPGEIFSAAVDRIPKNYFSQPFLQNTFYREIQQANGKYVSLIEAALTIYDPGYDRRGHEKVKVLQLRKSKGYQHATHSFWDTHNVLLSALGLNEVRQFDKNDVKRYHLNREANTLLNGKSVYVLTTQASKEFWPMRLYIQCDNFAFVRVEALYDVTTDGEKVWIQNNNDTIKVYPQNRKLILEYKPSPEKYSLSMLSHSILMIYKGRSTNKELLQFSIQQDLLVNEVQSENVKPFDKHETLLFNVNIEDQPFKYDPEFWKRYNVIQETPLQEKIRKDLEAETPLEEQFKTQYKVSNPKRRN